MVDQREPVENDDIRHFTGDNVEDLVTMLDCQQYLASINPSTSPYIRVGKYRVEDKLGSGGMGVVFSAVDTENHTRVALKTFRQKESNDARRRSQLRQKLIAEANVMRHVRHRNIIEFIDCCVVGELTLIVMEYVDGQTLGQWLGEEPSLALVVRALIGVGEALIVVHAKGLAHSDIKPSNIMIDQQGSARLMDFGLAAVAADLEITMTADDAEWAGTALYMAPEHFNDNFTDALSDQFSFCLTFHEALYGESPFVGETLRARWEAAENGRFRPAPEGSKIPVRIREILHRGLGGGRSQRYPSMRTLLDVLIQECIEHYLIFPVPRPPPYMHWIFRLSVVVLASASLVGLVVVALGPWQISGSSGTDTGTDTSAQSESEADVEGDLPTSATSTLDGGSTTGFEPGEPCDFDNECESGSCVHRPCHQRVAKGVPLQGGIGGTEFEIPDACEPAGRATMSAAGCGSGVLEGKPSGLYQANTNGADYCYGTVNLREKNTVCK